MADETKISGLLSGDLDPAEQEALLTRIRVMEMTDIAEDPDFEIYRLYSDVIQILKNAYGAVGMGRPLYQVHTDAMDIMLRSLSSENEGDPVEMMKLLIRENVSRLRELPEDYGAQLDGIFKKREEQKDRMTAEEFLREVFSAYLASRDMNEADWVAENRHRILGGENGNNE